MRDRIFYAVCFGFLLGVLLRSFLYVNVYFTIFLLGLSVVSSLFSYFTKLKWGVIIFVFLFSSSLGVLRFHISDDPAPVITEKTLTGIIIDEPDIRENNQKLTIQTNSVKILATVNFNQEFKYGDEVSVEGKLERPENFITDQGKEFDYINYLRKDGILYVTSYPKVEVISRGHGNFIKSALFSVKEKFLEKMNFAIRSPESLLMGGLILGEKSSFNQELRQSFVDTGTIHIVALSGYNVTIVAEWIMKIFSLVAFLPKNFGFGMGIFGIFLFVIMSGASSTAIRAGIMATLALVAKLTGRNYDVGRALILAGVVMILFNPFVLVYDVSFQLSFIATVAVIFFAPRI